MVLASPACSPPLSLFRTDLLSSPLDQMPNTTSILSGSYNIFSKMDSALDLHPAAHMVVQSGHLSYYIAIACVLLAVFLAQSTKQSKMIADIPFYKAAKTKWIFDAETLVRDSYNKVHTYKYCVARHGWPL